MGEEVLTGGHENPGHVVRIGETVRRPRHAGSLVVEALLLHLETVGFAEAPRFLGIDDSGRQILTFINGHADDPAPWQHNDEANADQLGRVATVLARLHDATSTFAPPAHEAPRRSLALPGEAWTHGDVGYSNIVFSGERLIGFIDWEFAAPGHRHNDLVALLAMSVRGPKLGADDNPRRAEAVTLASHSIADGYGLDDAERVRLLSMAASFIDDALTHWQKATPDESFAAWRWRADWFRRFEP